MQVSSMNFLFVMAATLALAGCGTAYPGSPQGCGGINQAEIAYNAKTGQVGASLCGGKESENVKLSGKTPDGLEFSYEAQGARAFDGQMTQAELNESLSRERVETIRELIKLIRPGLPSAMPVIP